VSLVTQPAPRNLPFLLTLVAATLASSATAQPSISIGNRSMAEGDAQTRTLTLYASLSAPAAGTVTVNFATADSTATVANHDYEATSGMLWDPGADLTVQGLTVSGLIV
jgi:hypothetical protein